MPIADPRPRPHDSGFAPARIYRKVSRGAHLDVFCLDMRTYKDPNTAGPRARTARTSSARSRWTG